MAADQRAVLGVIFTELGLGPVPDRPNPVEEFELDDARCSVSQDGSGTAVLISMEVGTLSGDPHGAADRLRRLLRISLGLAAANRASLVCDGAGDDAVLRAMAAGGVDLRFRAVALVQEASRRAVLGALQDVVQLRLMALPHVAASRPDGLFGELPDLTPSPRAGRQGDAEDGGGLLIFQP